MKRVYRLYRGAYQEEKENNRRITKSDMVTKIGKSEATLSRIMKRLKDKGLVEHVGSNKTGFWIIKQRKKLSENESFYIVRCSVSINQ